MFKIELPFIKIEDRKQLKDFCKITNMFLSDFDINNFPISIKGVGSQCVIVRPDEVSIAEAHMSLNQFKESKFVNDEGFFELPVTQEKEDEKDPHLITYEKEGQKISYDERTKIVSHSTKKGVFMECKVPNDWGMTRVFQFMDSLMDVTKYLI